MFPFMTMRTRQVVNQGFRFGQIVAIVLAGFFLAGPVRAEDKPKTYKVKTVKDIVYYDGADMDKVKHKLDLYLPEGLKDFPVLFFVHGGAWITGDRNYAFGLYGNVAKVYAKQGVGVVVISYRLSPGVKHPEHIKDVARAFAWTHDNIAKYGGNPDRVFLSGHSAGGHLVALLTTDEQYLKAHNLTTKAIRGVIPISGVYTVPERILPNVFGTDDDSGKKASPITYVKKGLPPFLILYADGDLPLCGKLPSEKFCKALEAKGTKAQTLEIKDSDHFRILFASAKPGTKVSSAIMAFIRDHGGS